MYYLPSQVTVNWGLSSSLHSLTSKAHGWAAARIAAITEAMFGMAAVRGGVLLFSVFYNRSLSTSTHWVCKPTKPENYGENECSQLSVFFQDCQWPPHFPIWWSLVGIVECRLFRTAAMQEQSAKPQREQLPQAAAARAASTRNSRVTKTISGPPARAHHMGCLAHVPTRNLVF